MATGNRESAGPRGREDGALSYILGAIAVVSIAITVVEKWDLLPAVMRYLLAITVLVLSLALLTILFRKWLTERLQRLIRDKRTKKALRSQLPQLDIFVGDLQRNVADQNVYSLAAVVDGLTRDPAGWEEMQTAVGALGVLRHWVSCFSGQWELAKQRLTIAGAQHLLGELRFLLMEVQSIAKQCEAQVPTTDGEVDEVHDEPAPYAEIRNTWKQFSADYNRLVDDYRAINKYCARHIQGLTVFEFDTL